MGGGPGGGPGGNTGAAIGAIAGTVVGVGPVVGAGIGGLIGEGIASQGMTASGEVGIGQDAGGSMNGDPADGNAVGGPDGNTYTKRSPSLVDTKKEPISSIPAVEAEPSIQDELDQIDLMNKLARNRNLRFAPGRGVESYERQLDTLAERDQLVGSRGPSLFKRTPRTVVERYEGSPVNYGSRL